MFAYNVARKCTSHINENYMKKKPTRNIEFKRLTNGAQKPGRMRFGVRTRVERR